MKWPRLSGVIDGTLLSTMMSHSDIETRPISSGHLPAQHIDEKASAESKSPPSSPVIPPEFKLTPSERRREWIQFATLCWSLFLIGWSDGTPGPLLPTMQSFYGLSYAVVSLIFIFNTLVSHMLVQCMRCVRAIIM